MGVSLSQGSFSPRDFFLVFLHSLLQASEKRMALETDIVPEGNCFI